MSVPVMHGYCLPVTGRAEDEDNGKIIAGKGRLLDNFLNHYRLWYLTKQSVL